jgi:tRNA A37 threonylcarbamoyladenosine biosynthesis protein TsaE
VPEVADLALAELVEDDAIALVEWGDLAAPALGESVLEVTLVAPDAVATPQARAVSIVGRGQWSDRADEVAAVLEPAAGRALR